MGGNGSGVEWGANWKFHLGCQCEEDQTEKELLKPQQQGAEEASPPPYSPWPAVASKASTSQTTQTQAGVEFLMDGPAV